MFVSGRIAARTLGVSLCTLRKWAKIGFIPHYRFPDQSDGAKGALRYDVDAFLANKNIKDIGASDISDEDIERILNEDE